MAADDLSTPLGQGAGKKPRIQLPIAVPQAVAGVLGLCVAVFAGWTVLVDDPLGGEPMAVIPTPAPVAKAEPMPAVSTAPASGARSYEGPVPGQAAAPPGSQTVTIIDGSTGQRQEVPSPGTADRNAPVEQRLLETSRHGPIPKIGPDGARPAEIYARPVKPPAGKQDSARIAIVVGGLGISAAITQEALTKLPAPVTLAFVPYGPEAERLVTRARTNGHEVLLQVPMEPFDYPDNDPGPQTLLTTLGPDQNVDRLHWLMSRFQGYVGVASLMGARFTASEPALSPVLRETAKRGLIYFDDGASPRSLASQIAGSNNTPFAKAELQLDAVPNPVSIDRALTKLEATARERGVAVGFTSALPAAIERIAQWAKAAEGRGIVLVPISAVAVKAKSS